MTASLPRERLLEIRTYRVRRGQQARLGDRMTAASPLLHRYEIDVVWMGPSVADDQHYILLRSFESLERREALEDAFYGSDEWRSGPREAIVSRIENSISVVIPSGDLHTAERSTVGSSREEER